MEFSLYCPSYYYYYFLFENIFTVFYCCLSYKRKHYNTKTSRGDQNNIDCVIASTNHKPITMNKIFVILPL